MTDARPSSSRPAAPPTRLGAKLPPDTASVAGGETLIGPSADGPASTMIMPAGPYAGLLGPPEADGELGRLGGYAVLRELGRGGMGLVFEAEDPKLKRRVALKVMLPEFARQPQAKERFLREARSGAAVEHEHVVPVYQVGEDGDVPFLAMRLLPGESLSDLLARKGTLPPVSVAGLGRQAALGLAAAHERGLIHRDIKPANLWVEPGGRVRVLDFGLARPTEAVGELTRTGAVVGTPEYLAPEQLRGEDLDGRADLFSLGAVLYRAATGESPFRRDTLYGTLRAVEAEAPPDPRTHRPDLPAPLAELILRLLAKDRNGRPMNAAAAAKMFKDMGPALAKSAPAADPESARRDAPSPTVVAPAATAPSHDFSVAPTGPAMPTAFPVFDPPSVLPSRVAPRTAAPKPPPKRGAQTKAAAGGQPPWKNRNLLFAAGGGFLAFLGVIFALTLDFGDAILRIENLDPDMQVTVTGGRTVTVLDAKTGAIAELDPGTYWLTLTGGSGEGFTTVLKETKITLSRGDEKVVVIQKFPKPEAAQQSAAAPTRPDAEPVETGHALQFDGRSSHMAVPSLTFDGSHPITLEAWVRPRAVGEHATVVGNLRYEGQQGIALKISPVGSAGRPEQWDGWEAIGGTPGGELAFFKQPPEKQSPDDVGLGRTFHVAAVWTGKELILFREGRRIGATDVPEGLGAPGAGFVIGAAADSLPGQGFFDGVIDEVRISKAARYESNFEPRRRLESDPDTLALYHFDEGAGTLANDASGNGHDGTIIDASWVPGPSSGVASVRVGSVDLLARPDLAGWTPLSLPGNGPAPPGQWVLRDGVLESATRDPGWLRYDHTFADFELELEFLVPEGGDSGVLIRHSGEEPLPEHGMEIQILDAEPGRYAGSQAIGSIYGAAAPTADRMKRGEWNRMSITCRGERVAVTLNGENVVDAAMNENPALAGRPRSGFIGLYGYDGTAAGTKFRNVRLRDFSNPTPSAVTGSPPASSDPDLEVARWALATGARSLTVKVGDRLVPVKTPAELPAEPFRIHKLDVDPNATTDSDLGRIAKLGPIAALWLGNARVSAAGLKRLATIGGVTELEISGPRSGEDLAAIAAIPKLRQLVWSDADASAEDLSRLSDADLRVVWLSGPQTRLGAKQLRAIGEACPQLNDFAAREFELPPAVFAAPDVFPNLLLLNVSPDLLTAEFCDVLRGRTSFKSLGVNYSSADQAVEWDRLAQLPALETVMLIHLKADAAAREIAGLASLPHLRKLDIASGVVTDDAVDALVSLKRLENLWISGHASRLTSAGVARVKAAHPRARIDARPAETASPAAR